MGQHGVQRSTFLIGCPLHRHIGPGAHQHQGTRLAAALSLYGKGQFQRQVAARRIPGHDHILRADAHIHQVVPDAQGIVNGGRIRRFGGKAVFKAEYIAPGGKGQFAGQHAGIAQLAAGVAAAMAV